MTSGPIPSPGNTAMEKDAFVAMDHLTRTASPGAAAVNVSVGACRVVVIL